MTQFTFYMLKDCYHQIFYYNQIEHNLINYLLCKVIVTYFFYSKFLNPN
jgi:hypothetical protein